MMKIFRHILAAATALLAVATASAVTQTTTFAYASRDAATEPSGTGKKETYDVAIALTNPALVGKRITAVEIPVIASLKVSGLKVWVSHELRLELINGKNVNVADRSWDLAMPTEGKEQWVTLTLDEPYTVPAGGLYVGYSLTVDETDRSEGTQVPIVTAIGGKTGGFFLHTSRSFLNWRDRSDELGVTAMTQVELEGEFLVNAATIGAIPQSYLSVGREQTVGVDVYNIGLSPISSLTYTSRLGGEEYSGRLDLDKPLPAVFAYFETLPFTLPAIDTMGEQEISIEITGVNEMDNDATDATMAESTAQVIKFVPRKLALVEEYTGTWCGWCPAGFVAMEVMGELYPDFVGIAYHDKDPMAMRGGYPDMVSGFPEAVVSRSFNTHPYEATGLSGVFGMPQVWEQYCDGFVPVGIDIAAEWNDADGTVAATSTVEWVLDGADPADNYRVEYVLVADDLHGDDFGWWQHNYFATEPMRPYMEQFCGADSYVKGLHFNDVAILTSGNKGVAASVTDTSAGAVNRYTHTFDTSKALNYQGAPIPFDKEKLRVVAFLLKGDGYGTVVNAAKCRVSTDSGIAAVGADSRNAAVYNLQGIRVLDSAADLHRLPAGIYITSGRKIHLTR